MPRGAGAIGQPGFPVARHQGRAIEPDTRKRIAARKLLRPQRQGEECYALPPVYFGAAGKKHGPILRTLFHFSRVMG